MEKGSNNVKILRLKDEWIHFKTNPESKDSSHYRLLSVSSTSKVY